MPTSVPCLNPKRCRAQTHRLTSGASAKCGAYLSNAARPAQSADVAVPPATTSTGQPAAANAFNVKGWPRPRADVEVKGQTKSWPVPWMSAVFADYQSGETKIVLDSFDTRRANDAIEDMLCQVCGNPCAETSYVPVAPVDRGGDGISCSGTPLCSERCARLALSICPHFPTGSFIASFPTADAVFDEVDTAFIVSSYDRL